MYIIPIKYGSQTVLILRIYDAVVDLNNPNRTWSLYASHQVEVLPEGSRIEIVAQSIKEDE